MILMTILKIIFVILLCLPLAYFALRLFRNLNQYLVKDSRRRRRSQEERR